MIIREMFEMIGKEKRRKQRIQNAKTLAIGISAAAAAGLAAGILFAPKSGKETRKDIKEKAKEVVDNTKDAAVKNARALKESAAEAVQGISDVLKDAHEKKVAVDEALKEGSRDVSKVIHETSEKIAEDLKHFDK